MAYVKRLYGIGLIPGRQVPTSLKKKYHLQCALLDALLSFSAKSSNWMGSDPFKRSLQSKGRQAEKDCTPDAYFRLLHGIDSRCPLATWHSQKCLLLKMPVSLAPALTPQSVSGRTAVSRLMLSAVNLYLSSCTSDIFQTKWFNFSGYWIPWILSCALFWNMCLSPQHARINLLPHCLTVHRRMDFPLPTAHLLLSLSPLSQIWYILVSSSPLSPLFAPCDRLR